MNGAGVPIAELMNVELRVDDIIEHLTGFAGIRPAEAYAMHWERKHDTLGNATKPFSYCCRQFSCSFVVICCFWVVVFF